MGYIRKEKGLTLLSLVITIVAMIILAGVAIKLGVGDNGIIGLTSNKVEQYTNSVEQEQSGENIFVEKLNEILDEDIDTTLTGESETIIDQPSIEISGWTNEGGIVELSTNLEYTTQYRIRNSSWQEYTGEINVKNKDKVYARYKKNNEVSKVVGKIIEDTKGPEVTITNKEVNGGNISIKVTANDNEMGMSTTAIYNYYIKLQSESEYTNVGHNTSRRVYIY